MQGQVGSLNGIDRFEKVFICTCDFSEMLFMFFSSANLGKTEVQYQKILRMIEKPTSNQFKKTELKLVSGSSLPLNFSVNFCVIKMGLLI